MRNNPIVTIDTVVIQDSEPVVATVQDNVVLLSLRAGAFFKLNTIGGQIWNMLVEPRSVHEIVDALARTHEADAETMVRDIAAFLDSLIDRRLVRVVDRDDSR